MLLLILANVLWVMSLYALTLFFYVLLKPVESSKRQHSELPFVSVIVPARNEEGKIGRCIESLLKQNYPNFELIVIDDRSTDSTGDIIASYAAKDSRIKFVKGKDAPSGWIGKCNALAHAVGYASGEWFIFTDADTCHKPNSIADSVSYGIANKIDLMSFLPLQELGSFPEKLIMPILLSAFLIGDPLHAVNDPRDKRAYAHGQYILCRRSSYLAVGGHQSVRDEIVEDHALARVFKEKGYKIEVADGKTLYSVRMYTDLTSLWHGWTKNLYSFLDSKPFNLIVVLLAINAAVVQPWFWLGYVCYQWSTGEISELLVRMTALVMVLFSLLALWQLRTNSHHEGMRWYHFFLSPVGCLCVSALYLHAAYLVHSGGRVNWKGRHYVVNTRQTIEPQDGTREAGLDGKLVSRDVSD